MRGIAIVLIGLVCLTALSGCVPASAVTAPPSNSVANASRLGVAYNAATDLYYVVSPKSNAVLVYNGLSNSLVATIPTGNNPGAVVVNSVTDIVYVTNYNDKSVSVIDGVANKVKATITSVGDSPFAIAVNPITNKIYVADWLQETGNNLFVFDGNTNALLAGLQVGLSVDYVGGLAVNTTTNKIYASTMNGVDVVDGTTNTVTAPATLSGLCGAGVAVDQTTNTVYVITTQNENAITSIDGSNNNIISTIGLPDAPVSLAVDPVTHLVYVAISVYKSLAVVNGGTMAITKSIPLSDYPLGLDLNTTNNLVYVAGQSSTSAVGM